MYPILIFTLVTALSGCAYRFGLSERALPGGYTQVAIPVFKNQSNEVGIENFFTNSLIRRFSRSQVARVTEKDNSPVLLMGYIEYVQTINGPAVTNSTAAVPLPDQTVLITEYRLVARARLVLTRKSDDKVLWQGSFTNEKVYAPPRIRGEIVNSANATYNQSVRMETIAVLADEMMAEAHDRMTENF